MAQRLQQADARKDIRYVEFIMTVALRTGESPDFVRQMISQYANEE